VNVPTKRADSIYEDDDGSSLSLTEDSQER
jgi:hypothetical protein